MPKNDKQTRATAAAGSRADQVRSAVEGAFQAAGAQIGRDRAIDLADELASAAQRVREALEELRPPSADDLKRISARLTAIERRLSALEDKPAAAPRKAAPRKAAAKRGTRSAAKPKQSTRAAAKPRSAG